MSTYTFGQSIVAQPQTIAFRISSIKAKSTSGDNQLVNDIVISWDFSETTNKDHLELRLQVQPLNACWKGLDGSDRSEVKTSKFSNFSQNASGNHRLRHSNINSKCIKWKAIIIDPNTNCETKTDWQFASFL